MSHMVTAVTEMPSAASPRARDDRPSRRLCARRATPSPVRLLALSATRTAPNCKASVSRAARSFDVLAHALRDGVIAQRGGRNARVPGRFGHGLLSDLAECSWTGAHMSLGVALTCK